MTVDARGSDPPGFDSTFRGKTVLVTGHTGFKGSWLCLWLQRMGATVAGLALDPPTTPSNFVESRVSDRLALDVRGDVRDKVAVHRMVESVGPDVIFHLAAQPLVRRGVDDPFGTFEVNVMGTVTLLEAVYRVGKPCVVVVVTSDKCYDAVHHTTAHAESDRLGGTEPYGTSKAAAELVVAAYRTTFFPPDRVADHGVRLASARAGNVIGGGDWAADRIMPDTIRSLRSGHAVPVRFPEAIRPWQHVVEPLSGYLLLAARLLREGPEGAGPLCAAWNFGPRPTDEMSVRHVVDAAIRCWGGGEWVHVSDDVRRHEAGALRLRVDKAVDELRWRPHWAVDEAVRRTVRWYRRHGEHPGTDMAMDCYRDIDDYGQGRGT